mmetsp:Transcript_12434/g.20139  ORF Transcript_12434/g.20139 Transcript_12434/m.20139 type:complete len:625 (+) Transcript_12434:222-2096(+)|eukprot:CAMPEP_0171498564 /NCGR_PEP_ID=MMETSP0958-20121227/7927_1 /TAXON_ID=87120 /ORGANISM="Aurantiochytrium limacinum, Strain ATCCMYA-1381" /LENGTH=624 /DNA_ID=CAMNT_0012032991 /DNA_START=157 /DNA_END=2031 /DNA_ORIENTATION=+
MRQRNIAARGLSPSNKRDGHSTEGFRGSQEKVYSRSPTDETGYRNSVSNPFEYNAPVTVYEFAKIAIHIFSGFLFIRAILFAMLFLSAYGCAFVATIGLDREAGVYEAPLPRWRRLILKPISSIARAMLFVIGFYRIEVAGEISKEACFFTPNHVGLTDLLLMYWLLLPSALSKAEAFKVPFVGTLFRGLQVIPVQRDSAADKKRAMETIKLFAASRTNEGDPNKRFPPILVFPQGTTANQETLTMFQRGAFTPGCPVQPVSLYYPWKHFNPAFIVNRKTDYFWVRHFSQFVMHARVHFLPVHSPSEAEKKNATLFANNVRREIAEDIGANITEHCYEDAMLYRSALNVEETRHQPRLFKGVNPHEKISLEGLELRRIKDLFEHARRDRGLTLKDAKLILKQFADADKDGDGLVDLSEFARAIGFDKDSNQVKRLFNFFDRDLSGKIDFRELLTGMANVHPFSSSKDKIKFAFELFDQDGDGYVSETELWNLWNVATENTDSQRFAEESRIELRNLIETVHNRRLLADGNIRSSSSNEIRISLEEFQDLVERDSEIVATALTSIEAETHSSESKKRFFPFLLRRTSSSKFAQLDGGPLDSEPACDVMNGTTTDSSSNSTASCSE